MYRVLGERVLIKPDETMNKTTGGIYLPDESRPIPTEGVVISAGDLVSDIEPGDRVLFSKYGGHIITDDDGEYVLIDAKLVYAKI